jgi:hypothetical protein
MVKRKANNKKSKRPNHEIVQEILEITKVPFKKNSIDQRPKSKSYANKILKYDKDKFFEPAVQNQLMTEDMELDQIHSKVLTYNISSGMNRQSIQTSSILPNMSQNVSKNVGRIGRTPDLRKSSTAQSITLTDFKKGNKFVKEQKDVKFIKRRSNRAVSTLDSKTGVHKWNFTNNTSNPSFTHF